MARKRKKKKLRGKLPPKCRICGEPIGFIPGLKFPVNPGRIEIVLWGEPKELEGYTVHGDKVWGRRTKEADSDTVVRIVEMWTRHVCDPDSSKHPNKRPAPDPEEKWGAERATGEEE